MIMKKILGFLGPSLLALNLIFYPGCGKERKEEEVAAVQNNQELLNAALRYLIYDDFSDLFFGQMTGINNIELELYNKDEGMLYFSVPSEKQYYDNKGTFAELTKRPELIEFGRISEDGIRLGNYRLNKKNRLFFRFPVEDLNINESFVLKIELGNIEYDVTIDELGNFLKNKTIYGGPLNEYVIFMYNNKLFFNYGAFVAVKGEPSLGRLVKKITENCDSDYSVAQKLLDFVAGSIEYDKSFEWRKKGLIRPNEILMARKADCSGKAILYASLLEQIVGIDYLLVYGKVKGEGHMTVAVKYNENFPGNRNSFEFKNEKYVIAEPSAIDFKIGISILKTNIEIEQVQKPSRDFLIYNLNGELLPFY